MARQQAGLTQVELAAAAGVSVGTYRGWEKGRALPSSSQILKICEVLKIRSEFLFRDGGVELGDVHWA